MLKSLIGATLLTMGVGVSTPTPNFIRADTNQNGGYSYTPQYYLEQMNDNYADGFAYDKWVEQAQDDSFYAIAQDKPHIYQEEDTHYFINGYYGTITEDQYNSAITQTHWNNESGWENTSILAFKDYGDSVKTNATIKVNYQNNTKYYGCKWLSRISVYSTTNNFLDDLYEEGHENITYTDEAPYIAYQLDIKTSQYATINKTQVQDYGTFGVIQSGSQLIWPTPSIKELSLDITLTYNATTTIFVVLQNFYVETSSTEYGYIKGVNDFPNAEDGLYFSYIDSVVVNYYTPTETINYEYIDLPRMMFNILTMPFAFISQAFNLTIFPGTSYALNISNLFLAIIGIAVFVFVLKKILK